jgi:DNA repair protein RadA/Sms
VAKSQSRYVCQNCGEAFLRWEGQCRSCGVWNSLVETLVREPAHPRPGGAIACRRAGRRSRLRDVADADLPRLPAASASSTACLAAARARSLVLVGGEPGVGKSTLLLQVAGRPRDERRRGSVVLYATGEESAAQVRLRAAGSAC